MKIVKLTVPDIFIGRSLSEVNFERDYDVKLIAHKNNGVWHTDINASVIIAPHDVLVLLGNTTEIENLVVPFSVQPFVKHRQKPPVLLRRQSGARSF